MKKTLLFLVFLLVASAFTQPMMGRPNADPETMERLQTIMKWKLLEELDMTDEQTNSFIPIYSKWESTNKANDENHHNCLRAIRKLMKDDNPDENKIDSLTIELLNLKSEIFDTEISFYEKTREFLNPIQQIKLMTFHQRFREEMRGLLNKFDGERNFRKDDKQKEKR